MRKFENFTKHERECQKTYKIRIKTKRLIDSISSGIWIQALVEFQENKSQKTERK